ncbi:hypothetical protein HMPREF0277_1367 [Corynebacterium accolens ATCC 49726]|nr:hypothetical protein HMPREF0277_1367 [Corynebacterium accolens ATCC 49726]
MELLRTRLTTFKEGGLMFIFSNIVIAQVKSFSALPFERSLVVH